MIMPHSAVAVERHDYVAGKNVVGPGGVSVIA